jgi:hypothetical protein
MFGSGTPSSSRRDRAEPLRFAQDLLDPNREIPLDHHNLTSRHRAIVDNDIDRLGNRPISLKIDPVVSCMW